MGDIAELKAAHTVVAEQAFEVVPIEKGYANRYLRVDLSSNEISMHAVTEQMKDLWVGGKGFDLWLMFQELTEKTKWTDPANPICFSSGPLGGTTSFPGSGKTIVTAISPSTGSIMDCNVGGFFGPYFKFAGFDALVLVGRAPEAPARPAGERVGAVPRGAVTLASSARCPRHAAGNPRLCCSR